MARIKGVDIPNNKRTVIALTYIYGIGKSLATKICKDAGVDENIRAKDLTNEQVAALRDEVNKYLTEGDLRREVNMNIKTKMEINSYQGIRHKLYHLLDKQSQLYQTNLYYRKIPEHYFDMEVHTVLFHH